MTSEMLLFSFFFNVGLDDLQEQMYKVLKLYNLNMHFGWFGALGFKYKSLRLQIFS